MIPNASAVEGFHQFCTLVLKLMKLNKVATSGAHEMWSIGRVSWEQRKR